MANTNRPTVNTHQQVIVPANGDAVLGRVGNRLRYYNNYPVVEKQIGQDPKYYVKRRPPVEASGINVTTAPQINRISSVFYDQASKYTWFVNDRTPTFLVPGIATPTEDINRLDATTLSGIGFYPDTSIEKYSVAETDWIVIASTSVVGNTKFHYYDDSGIFNETVDSATVMNGKLVFMDGYMFMASNAGQGQRIYNSTLGNPKEWLIGASFIDAEMSSDQIISLARHHNHIVAFGRRSIEFFYNSSNEIGSPLTRQVAYAKTDVGLYNFGSPGSFEGAFAENAMIEVGDVIYFIATANGNMLGLYKIDNFQLEKISDYTLDVELRSMMYPKLATFDLNGETCVMVLDQMGVNLPLIFIPSMKITIEFSWAFNPTNAVAAGSWGRSFGTVLFKTDGVDRNCIYFSGDYQYVNYLVQQTEDFASQYVVDYLDFNNNARKHWKYVDLLGSFGTNRVAIGYRNDNYGYDNSTFVNLPYVTASDAGPINNIRFRNLGNSRRQGYTIFFTGVQDYLYKGIAVGYNQWGE